MCFLSWLLLDRVLAPQPLSQALILFLPLPWQKKKKKSPGDSLSLLSLGQTSAAASEKNHLEAGQIDFSPHHRPLLANRVRLQELRLQAKGRSRVRKKGGGDGGSA